MYLFSRPCFLLFNIHATHRQQWCRYLAKASDSQAKADCFLIIIPYKLSFYSLLPSSDGQTKMRTLDTSCDLRKQEVTITHMQSCPEISFRCPRKIKRQILFPVRLWRCMSLCVSIIQRAWIWTDTEQTGSDMDLYLRSMGSVLWLLYTSTFGKCRREVAWNRGAIVNITRWQFSWREHRRPQQQQRQQK